MLSDILLIIGLLIFWTLVSSICFRVFPCPEQLKPKNTGNRKSKAYYDYYGNYVSIAHAIITFILSTYAFIKEGITVGEDNTPAINLVLYNSFAYFVYDTAVSEYYRYNTLPMTVHHITAVSITLASILLQNSGNEIVTCLMMAELNNPFNLSREIMKRFSMENTKIYFYMSLTFAILFVITRFICVPILLTMYYPGRTHIVVKLLAAMMWFVSWHWLFAILNLASKEIKNFAKKTDHTTTSRVLEVFYSFMVNCRKKKAFLGSYYLTAFFLCYGTLYMTHKA